MAFARPTKQQALKHLGALVAQCDEAWVNKSDGISSAEEKGWFEDAKLAVQRIFGPSSQEYLSLVGGVTHPLWTRDILQSAIFLKGRLRDIEMYWQDDNGEDVTHKRMVREDHSKGVKLPDRNPVENEVKRHCTFVVHGRDERLRSGLFTFLRSLGLQPLEFGEARQLTGKPMPYVGEILDAAFQRAQAVVVLLSPDDEARLRSDLAGKNDPASENELSGQARPNVLFEAGMALVSHPDQTILVQFGSVRPFSDVAGRHILHMDNTVAKRQELAQRLIAAKCLVNLNGTDWHTSGDLNPPV